MSCGILCIMTVLKPERAVRLYNFIIVFTVSCMRQ